MKLKIAITVDTNDADHITKISDITAEELLELQPVFEAIRNFRPYRGRSERLEHTHYHNWPCGEYSPREDLGEKFPAQIYPQLTEDQIDFFSDICPHGEYGFHSVREIRLLEVADEKVLVTTDAVTIHNMEPV